MIRLYTLGSIELQSHDGEQLSGVIAQPKRLALLAYLVLARPFGFHRRDRLFAMFWPEQDDAHARDSLNQAVRFLRQSLGTDVVVSRGADEVGVDRTHLWCDAVEFQTAAEGRRPDEMMPLYRGELLDGFFVSDSRGFEEWLDGERARLREQASDAARTLAEREETAGNVTHALRWGKLAAGLSNGDERALRRWLAMLARAGDRAGAMQAYDDFARRLRADLDVEPSAETQALIEDIRRGMVEVPARIRPRVAESPERGDVRPAPFARGETVADGRYVIDHEIGAGGMATVYVARDVRHERRVAMKVLRPEIALAIGAHGFLREIRIAAGLQHPHIVPLFDSGAIGGELYYVMPYVDGESLRARLARDGTLPLGTALRIARELANALAYAHRHGIVHRDVKPENVLLAGAGGGADSHAMLADFGIARAIAESGAEHRLTQTGLVVGSPAYMSPEQAAGDELDGRSDVYSLGCVLYEMLVGTPPFSGTTRMAVLVKQVTAPIPTLRDRRPDLPASVVHLISRALAKAPADRYESAADFERAIHAVAAAGFSIPPRTPPSPPYSAEPRRRRRTIAMAIDALVVVTILAVATWKGLRTRYVTPTGSVPAVTSPVSADYDKRSLAMLYIEDLTPDGRFEVVATGLTSALIQQLRAARDLRVASPSVSGMFRRHRAVGYDSTARQFGIGTLLSGTLSSLGTGVRVDLQILDALSGQVVARSRVDQEDHDWLRLQRSLADAVTGLLRQRLGAAARAIESHPGTSNPAAWEAMQHARRELLAIDSLVCLRAGPMTLARIARADSLLQLVSRMDDGWNEPVIERASLGDRAMQSGVAPGDTTPQHWVKLGLEHVARVLARSPDDLHAVRVRGTLRYWQSIGSPEWPALLASADSDLSVAVKGDPGDAAGWNAWSGVLANRGQSSESRRALENAMRIDPLFPGLASTFTRLISVATVQGWSSEATRWCDEGVRRFPDNYKFAECRLWLQGLPGARPDTSRLWATRDEYVRKSPAYLSQFSKLKGNILVGLALVRAGQPGPGKMLADAARGDSVVDPTRELTYLAAVVYVQAGDTVTSVRWLADLVAADSSMRRVLEFRRRMWQLAPLAEVKRFRVLIGLRD